MQLAAAGRCLEWSDDSDRKKLLGFSGTIELLDENQPRVLGVAGERSLGEGRYRLKEYAMIKISASQDKLSECTGI